MKLGIADMVSNFVPGSGNPLGLDSSKWIKIQPVEKLTKVISIISQSNFDYVELGIPWLNEKGNSVPIELLQKKINKKNIQIGSYCSLFPPELKTVGPLVRWDEVTEYVTTVFRNCNILGGEIIVYGSGDSRLIPDGYSRGKAEEDFIRVLSIMSDIINENNYPLKIAVEPLNKKECNFITSITEADAIVSKVDSQNIGILIDTYHGFMQDGDFLSDIPFVADNLIHMHLAQPEDRGWPGHLLTSSNFQFIELFEILNKYNYNGNMTVECLFSNLEKEIHKCVDYLQGIRSNFTD
jgi:sugar phosphate isomerase/epimerase